MSKLIKYSKEEVTGTSATDAGESHHQEEQLGVPHMEMQLIYSFDVVNSFTSSSPVRSPRSMDATNVWKKSEVVKGESAVTSKGRKGTVDRKPSSDAASRNQLPTRRDTLLRGLQKE